MSDTITARLAEIRGQYAEYEKFKAADDGSVSSFINVVGSAAFAAVDGILPLLAAVEVALKPHEAQSTANGVKVCPQCSAVAGTAVRAPCDEVQAIAAALSSNRKVTAHG